MKKPKLFKSLFCIFFIVSWPLCAGEIISLASPDSNIIINVEIKPKLEPYPVGNRIYFSVLYKGQPVITDSPFGLDFKNMPPIARDLVVKDKKFSSTDLTWETVVGKSRAVVDRCNELVLFLQETKPPQRLLNLVFRAYNDGAAFRYQLPEQAAFQDFKLTSERTEFHFAGDCDVWAANYGSYATHQETEFPRGKVSGIKPGDIIGCPLLVRVNENTWAALTEANLYDWAGLYFTGTGYYPNAVVSTLSPRIDEPDVLVISKTPRFSPWRTIMIGDKPGDLIESDIILNLSEPCKIEDTSWIVPGRSAWDRWWCGSYAPDYDGELKVDNPSMKYFIDFAAEMGWEYQLVDWFWYGDPFLDDYWSNPVGDITKSLPEIDIPELVQYGKKKNVKILLWLEWSHANAQMDEAFPLYEKWGVAGVKVDFMARDDQEMVNFYHRLTEKAAQYHLTVDFHGAYKPTGMRRTWPNLLTREGVLGNEYNKWSDRITLEHTVILPFTRMLAGPMDFTPGGFRNKTAETFRAVGGDAPGPFVMGTRTRQLAMMVVYESQLQVLCDSPYNYRVSPAGLDFLKIVPTTWDETKVINGEVGDYITIARRSGRDWFVGSMTDSSARTLQIPLAFLGPGKFTAIIYQDPPEADDYPDRLQKREQTVTAKDIITANLASGGGFVMCLKPVK
ncbi:glycoside hydrolase family 97 protein [candidate division KSB1 bacterium]|nr:glycoside hydrolase family 97 protein [candidate division KSB1 bacterium]